VHTNVPKTFTEEYQTFGLLKKNYKRNQNESIIFVPHRTYQTHKKGGGNFDLAVRSTLISASRPFPLRPG